MTQTATTTADKFAQMAAGESVDVSLSNGVIRSSKDMWQQDEKGELFAVWHGIDDSETYFTKAGATEVLEGKRSPWDGDANASAN